MMKIRGVDFLLTFRCTARCVHCSYRANPEAQGFMPLSNAERWLNELKENHPLKTLTVHGGEPFLNTELLMSILRKAKKLEIENRWVITNSSWAISQSIAEELLNNLKEAGLKSITFSVDAFHQEYTPLARVKTGIDAAVRIGFDTVAVDSYLLGSEQVLNKYNTLTLQYTDELQEFTGVQFSRYPATFDGRGADNLTTYISTDGILPSGKCRLPFWLGGDIKNPEVVEIDFQGNVTLCPGLCIGNAAHESLPEVLSDYDYQRHPIISIIAEQNPIALLELAKARGYKEKKGFLNECHVCYEMRRFLQPHFRKYLAPSTCY